MKSMLKSLMSVAVAALAFTSCSTDATEDVMPNVGSQTLKVNATIDQTRTVMDTDHVNLKWEEKGEQIHLYIGATATTAESIDPVTGGEITGVTYNPGDKVYAYYSLPDENGKETSKSAKEALINIVKEQTQTDASIFAGKNLPMVASSLIENGTANLLFKPVGCVLVFNVYGQGTTAGEKVKSIKFETSKGCYGYDYCDLTADVFKYEAYNNGKTATVTLTNPATIGASKPSDTKVGENQIYLVVAQAEYPAGSKFTVTTDANNAYTFTTTTALDCSKVTARVVNLNLKNAPEMQPAIIAPANAGEQSSNPQSNLYIEGITIKNIANDQLEVGVYSNVELTEQEGVDWLTIVDNKADLLAKGTLHYNLTENTESTPRTAYIGIKGAGVQAAIAVTQVGAGSTPAENVVATYIPKDMGYNNQEIVTSVSLNDGDVNLAFVDGSNPTAYYDKGTAVRCYGGSKITVSASKISNIEIVRASGGDSNKLLADVGNMSGNTWTGNSDKVVLTVDGTSGHIRIAKMIITYVESKEPKIIVPTVADKQPAEGGTLKIQDIVIKNIDVASVTTGVYSNAELTESTNVAWLAIANADLASGTLSCNVAANDGAERTAYIGIKGGGVQAAIAVTQLAQGAVAAPDPTVAEIAKICSSTTYGEQSNDAWIVTCGSSNGTLGSNTNGAKFRTLAKYSALATAMGLTTTTKAAAVISKNALPAGYNTVTLTYEKVNASTTVGIAFSNDNGETWTKIKDFVSLKITSTTGSKSETYTFPQQGAGRYAFVAEANGANDAKITNCKIEFSQSQE